VLVFVLTAPSRAQEPVPLDAVLARMADAGEDFATLHADIDRDRVNGLLGSHALSSGEIFFAADGENSRIRMNLAEPAREELLVAEGKAQLFNASTLQLQEYTLGEGRRDVAEYLVVGFGPANSSLDTNFEIELEGEEELNGETVSVLLLTPRSAEVARQVNSIRLWVEHNRWIPLQQRLNTQGGDYLIVSYSDIQINGDIPNGTFRLDLPPNVIR
jgi:outer membrane lipoprotein-sorting protein